MASILTRPPVFKTRVGTVSRRPASARCPALDDGLYFVEDSDLGLIFNLRREGSSSISDPELEALLGQRIAAKGEVRLASTFIVSEWRLAATADVPAPDGRSGVEVPALPLTSPRSRPGR